MASLEAVGSVNVFTKDWKKAKDFYVRKVGLRVREEMPEFGYLALGATKGGEDASITVWEPNPPTWDGYEEAVKGIGDVTGIGFSTSNFDKTVQTLKRNRVKVDTQPMSEEGEEGRFGRFRDADGNVLFIVESTRAKVRRPGLSKLEFVTVACRDAAKTGAFFTKSLGMRGRRTPEQDLNEFRVTARGTAVVPFTPKREGYRDPADYEADMAHIGERTWIVFSTRDLPGLQDKLLTKGVRFKQKAEVKEWGGMEAEIYDPDDNIYGIIQYPLVRRGKS